MTATATKERPILFSGPMVRAILDGRKTQTRRLMKPQPSLPDRFLQWTRWNEEWATADARELEENREVVDEWTCPYGQPCDRLWVRENGWERPERSVRDLREGADTWPEWIYDADMKSADEENNWCKENGWYRRPSIHMPRRVCRLILDVVGIRADRLQSINEDEAIAEGCQCAGVPASIDNRGAFAKLWESINGKGSWASNPWVWVVEFKKVDGEENRE